MQALVCDHPQRAGADLWMGTHRRAASRLVGGQGLDDEIAAQPIGALGELVGRRYGDLPFMARVLSEGPRSLQVHPSQIEAATGFAREEAAGIELDSPSRSYRDPHHKPEFICAMAPVELLRGFRELDGTRELVGLLTDRRLDVVRDLLDARAPADEVLAAVVRWILTEPAAVGLAEIAARSASMVVPGSPFGDELAWLERLVARRPGDPAPLVALLMNHVRLSVGEGVFISPRTAHLYLGGEALEVMATSDNVVRAGLSERHVDVDEMLEIVDFRPETPFVQQPVGEVHTYVAPVPDFSVTRVAVDQASLVALPGPKLVLAASGRLHAATDVDEADLGVNEPWFVGATEGQLRLRGAGVAYVLGAGRCLL